MNKRVTQDEGLFFGARLTVVCKTQVIHTDLLEYTIILHKTRFFFPPKEKKMSKLLALWKITTSTFIPFLIH